MYVLASFISRKVLVTARACCVIPPGEARREAWGNTELQQAWNWNVPGRTSADWSSVKGKDMGKGKGDTSDTCIGKNYFTSKYYIILTFVVAVLGV